MWTTTYTIRSLPEIHDNYLRLPATLANSIQIRYSTDLFCKPIRLTRPQNLKFSRVFGWAGSISTSEKYIEISLSLATAIGLASNELVRVEALYEVNWIDKVNAKLDIEFDELSEMDKDYLEQNMLNQLCVVTNNSVYTIYLPGNRVVYANVYYDSKKYPLDYYFMKIDTELVVEFKAGVKTAEEERVIKGEYKEAIAVDDPELPFGMVVVPNGKELEYVEISYNKRGCKILKLEFEDFLKAGPKKRDAFHKLNSFQESFLVFLMKEEEGSEEGKVRMNMKNLERLHISDKSPIKYRSIIPDVSKVTKLIIAMSRSEHLSLELCKAAVRCYLSSFELPLILHHNTEHAVEWKTVFDSYKNEQKLEMLSTLLGLVGCSFKFTVTLPKEKDKPKYVILNTKDQIDSLELQFIEKHRERPIAKPPELPSLATTLVKHVTSYDVFCTEIANDLLKSPQNIQSTILCGENSKELAFQILSLISNHKVYPVYIDCLHLSLKGSLSNASMKSLKDYLLCKTFAALKVHKRIIVMFDRLDALCPAVDLSVGDTTNVLKSNFYSSAILGLLSYLRENTALNHKCGVLAVISSASGLNSTLISSFRDIKKVPKMQPIDQMNILGATFPKLEAESLKLLADKTANYSLANYYETFSSLMLLADKENFLEKSLKILENFKPSSIENIRLFKGSTTFNDVGGMYAQKAELTKIFSWPTKYPSLFANAPIKLPRGVLLYGPSGCGKTLLALSVARQFSLNLITVNGAEVLNKYIGASEQNLRQLFEDAKRCAPCIIFFDEFDSLAPIRGSGSTGVTDRLANQLLCYLDGFEELDKVYILAATTRPQAIDPAVLRPGRIDKIIECGLPSEQERKGIVHIGLKGFSGEGIEWEVDPAEIANKTQGYTGADLNGLLNTAFEEAVNKNCAAIKTQDILEKVVVKGKVEVIKYAKRDMQRTALMQQPIISNNKYVVSYICVGRAWLFRRVFSIGAECSLSDTSPLLEIESSRALPSPEKHGRALVGIGF
eukprot:TRINITY_DN511_c0_g1_i1.p1 TRINITY_DN511_c0_g1~~TRINITY_DN511_c0_g1_i1.p1  ORF type:complete len:1010 (+),score=91.32 TRINITY_DN511_c0_g1_i1:2999-6028(+)